MTKIITHQPSRGVFGLDVLYAYRVGQLTSITIAGLRGWFACTSILRNLQADSTASFRCGEA